MEVIRIATEDPKAEQWRILLQYSYPANVRRYFKENYSVDVSKTLEDCITSCMRQGEAYFVAADKAPLDISPLLYYYGMTNLLRGAVVLLKQDVPLITEHGMTLIVSDPKATRIADVRVQPRNAKTGALHIFSEIFSSNYQIVDGHTWNVKEILSLIPELKQEFENCYQSAPPRTLPLEFVHRKVDNHSIKLDRIQRSELKRYDNFEELIALVADYSNAYLSPNVTDTHLILNHRIKGVEIVSHTIRGQRYLRLGRSDIKDKTTPALLITLLKGLFALGFLSRYHPEQWMPFIKTDETGERLLIERFIAICQRAIPNLILNEILYKRVEFVHSIDTTLDFITK